MAASRTPAGSPTGAAGTGGTVPGHPRSPLPALVALSVGTFSFVTAETLPIGLLPQISADLHRSLSASGSLVTAYAVVVLLVSVPLTVLTRRIPKRWLMGGLLALFTVAALVSAAAPGFEVLLASRIAMAVAQALFWSVVTPTAAGLFAPERRVDALALLYTGSSLAPVAGLPAGTWLGQQAGWRTAFLALAALAGVACVVAVAALPDVARDDEPVRAGRAPDVRRYLLLVAVIALAVTGMFTIYTYVTAHLVDVAGLPPGAVSPALLATGAAGVLGAATSGTVMRRWPRAPLVPPLAVMLTASVVLLAVGRGRVAAVLAFALLALGSSSLAAGLADRVLQVAPGSTDLASAGTSSAFNAGIGAGSWIGGAVVSGAGVHATAVAAVAFTALALALAAGEDTLVTRRHRRPRPA